MPLRKNRGRNEAMMMSEELKMGRRTSREASYIVEISDLLSLGRSRRRRLCTFSTSTLASSTSEPMAMAMPPRLMVLMVSPRRCSTMRVTMMDSGSATSEMRVVRTSIRKKKRTMMTNIAPTNSDSCRLEMERSMKSA